MKLVLVNATAAAVSWCDKEGLWSGAQDTASVLLCKPMEKRWWVDSIYAMFWGPAEQDPRTLLAKHRYWQGGMDREQCLVSGLGSFVGDVIRIWVCNRS